jgi:hypothetical protein
MTAFFITFCLHITKVEKKKDKQRSTKHHRYLWTVPYMIAPPPLFFNIDFFSCTQHFATFYVPLDDIQMYIQ